MHPINALAMRISIETGLRISDVLAIKADVLRASPRIRIIQQKTNKPITIRLKPDTYQICLRYCGDIFLFPSRTNPAKPRSRKTIYKDMQSAIRALDRAGYDVVAYRSGTQRKISAAISPHCGRKTYAHTRLISGDTDSAIQKKLGHDRIETTLLYLSAAEIDICKKKRRSE